MLEELRKKLRRLVKLIEKKQRKPLYMDFEDQMDEVSTIELPGFTSADSFERFHSRRATLRKRLRMDFSRAAFSARIRFSFSMRSSIT